VGGDFYDVFERTAGGPAVVVGDVRGKGPAAAARTALARFTVRALAPREPSPAALLTELNRVMLDQSAERRHCSIVYATFERRDGGLAMSLSSGGHPPPFAVRAGGGVEPLGAPGSLVGLLEDVVHRDVAARLDPGDAIVFYTDGITEARRRGELFGDERLAAVLEAHRGAEARDLAGAVEAAVREFTDGPLQDDVAIVAVRAL
jgi:sigma-B regulation protein RsbU (phosphoserine phosphatase)